MFLPSQIQKNAFEIDHWPEGDWVFDRQMFPFYPENKISIELDPFDEQKYIHASFNTRDRYEGIGIVIDQSVPRTSSLHIIWRVKGYPGQIQLDLVEELTFNHIDEGEIFSFYTPSPEFIWTTLTIPLSQFQRNEYQDESRPKDGIFNTNNIRVLQICVPPVSNIDLDVKQIHFVWDYPKWFMFANFIFLGFLGTMLLRHSRKRLDRLEQENLFSNFHGVCLVYCLTTIAVAALHFELYEYFHDITLFSIPALFITVLWLDEFNSSIFFSSRIWRLRYAMILMFAWLLGCKFPPVFLFLLMLAVYVPLIQTKDISLSVLVAGLSVLGYMYYPYTDANHMLKDGILFVGANIAIAFLGYGVFYYMKMKRTSRQTATLYDTLCEHANDAIYIVDRQGFIQTFNHGFEVLVSMLPDEIIGRRIFDFIHPDDHHLLLFQNTGTTKDHQIVELRFINRDMEIRPAIVCEQSIQGNEWTQAIATDITEQKRMEAEYRRLAVAVDQTAEMIVITDSDLVIQYVNPAFEKNVGYRLDEIAGLPIHVIHNGQDDDNFYEKQFKTLSSGKVWSGHSTNRKKDGSVYEEESTISPIFNEAGRITHYVAVKRDVTNEIALKNQLLQSRKMEAIGQLAGGIAHDFNNLLTGIIGNISLIELTANEQNREFVQNAKLSAERAAELVKQLMAFGRKNPFELKVVDLNAIVKQVLSIIRQTIDRRIDIRVDTKDRLPSVRADTTEIHIVLMNLCFNARDAIQKKMSCSVDQETSEFSYAIQIKTELITRQSGETNGTTPKERFVVLTVSDNGIGMDEETQQKIFDPFFTTKGIGEGTGLGLSSVFGIIKQHQGWIEVHSEIGIGTDFQIYLPAVEETAAPIETAPVKKKITGNETILFVDDEEVIRKIAERSLSQFGYSLLFASNGKEALDLYQKKADSIDLIILDLSMPVMSGHEVIRQLHSMRAPVRVIISSGYSDQEYLNLAQLNGNYEIVSKPYQPQKLAECVHRVLQS